MIHPLAAYFGMHERVPQYRRIINLVLGPTIDLSIIQRWHQACQNSHGDCCNDRYSEALVHQIDEPILIDVVESSLVISPTFNHPHYIALSYMWGDVSTIKNLKSTFGTL